MPASLSRGPGVPLSCVDQTGCPSAHHRRAHWPAYRRRRYGRPRPPASPRGARRARTWRAAPSRCAAAIAPSARLPIAFCALPPGCTHSALGCASGTATATVPIEASLPALLSTVSTGIRSPSTSVLGFLSPALEDAAARQQRRRHQRRRQHVPAPHPFHAVPPHHRLLTYELCRDHQRPHARCAGIRRPGCPKAERGRSRDPRRAARRASAATAAPSRSLVIATNSAPACLGWPSFI